MDDRATEARVLAEFLERFPDSPAVEVNQRRLDQLLGARPESASVVEDHLADLEARGLLAQGRATLTPDSLRTALLVAMETQGPPREVAETEPPPEPIAEGLADGVVPVPGGGEVRP